MLIAGQHSDSVVINHGLNKESNFNVAVNGKAFRVLSDTLYQNKIGSIVREISSNARDSHIANGTPDVPFEIHLPNIYEPYFSVKDYGTGLSDDAIRTIYTTLFASTKDSSNDQVGAFGLGSKTPFSYTDAFNITSVFNNKKRVYSAYIQTEGSNAGIPAINLMVEEYTDEPNGLEVSLAVENKDINRFEKEVASQLKYFPIKPIIKNNSKFKFDNLKKYLISINGFNIIEHNDNDNHYVVKNITIIQGGVGYPLDLELITPHINNKGLNNFLGIVELYGADIHFNIGEIGVTPSRESISYDTTTINNIIKRFEHVFANLNSIFEEKLNSLKNNWERAIAMNDGGAIYSAFINDNKYGLTALDGNAIYSYNDVSKFIFDSEEKNNKNLFIFQRFTLKSHGEGYVFKEDSKNKNQRYIIPNAKTFVICIDHNCTFYKQRIRAWMMTLNNRTENVVYVISIKNETNISEDGVVSVTHNIIDSDIISKLSNKLGGVEIISCSSLPIPKKVTQVEDGEKVLKIRGPNSKYFRYAGNGDVGMISNYEKIYEKLSEKDSGYYFVLNDNKREIDISGEKLSLIRAAIHAGYISSDKFILIRKNDAGKMKNYPKWIDARIAIDEFITKYKSSKKMIRKLAYLDAMDDFHPDTHLFSEEIIKNINEPVIKRFLKLKNYNYGPNYEISFIRLIDSEYFSLIKSKFLAKFKAFSKKFEENYPLLYTISSRHFLLMTEDKQNAIKNAIINYIKNVN